MAAVKPLTHAPEACLGTVTWSRLAKAGAPLVGLSDGSVYLLHAGLRCWLRMAGSMSPASPFSSILSSATGVWSHNLLVACCQAALLCQSCLRLCCIQAPLQTSQGQALCICTPSAHLHPYLLS